VTLSSNDWIIINNGMGVRCNIAAVAYFKLLSRCFSRRDSEKQRKKTVQSMTVLLKM
jgi:hypothetical protein